MKALSLLKSQINVDARSTEFVSSSKRNIQRDIIDKLTERKEKITDEIAEISNSFSIVTDVNQGIVGLTREATESKFKKLIDLEYQLTLLEMEIKIKTEVFNKYFEDETSTK